MAPQFLGGMTAQDKGKGKLKDTDFEAAFAQFDTLAQSAASKEGARIEEISEGLEAVNLDEQKDAVSFKE